MARVVRDYVDRASRRERLNRVVDREGRITLPEVGGVQVSGRTLGDVQNLMQAALRTQFRGIEADVSLARLRTIRVYIVGDVGLLWQTRHRRNKG